MMTEALLQFVWQYQCFSDRALRLAGGQALRVLAPGTLNTLAGPDFANANLVFDDLQWRGSVELHLKASYWYRHQHQKDPNYDAVVLHVVWENDMEVVAKNGNPLPTLCLKPFVSEDFISRYHRIFEAKNRMFIPCEDALASFPNLKWQHWITRLYIERLDFKTAQIFSLLKQSKNDWEAVLFRLLAQNFGLNKNGDAFATMAASIPFRVVQKSSANLLQLEALLLGQSGLLSPKENAPNYLEVLQNEYNFLKRKYQLKKPIELQMHFIRLRPQNFPTIRLAQLARLYHEKNKLFEAVVAAQQPASLGWMKQLSVSPFWQSHYTFNPILSKPKKQLKKISTSFFDLICINTLVPLRFAYQQSQGKNAASAALHWMEQIAAEKNNVLTRFEQLGWQAKNALFAQGMLHLKKSYCNKKACLKCAIGHHLLMK